MSRRYLLKHIYSKPCKFHIESYVWYFTLKPSFLYWVFLILKIKVIYKGLVIKKKLGIVWMYLTCRSLL